MSDLFEVRKALRGVAIFVFVLFSCPQQASAEDSMSSIIYGGATSGHGLQVLLQGPLVPPTPHIQGSIGDQFSSM